MNNRRLERIEADLARRPLWSPVATAATTDRRLLIIGGQVVSGIDCIQYAASVTPAAAYDPDVTTTYPAGLGRAWLIEDGVNKGRVLVRHNLPGYMAVLIAGERARASYQETLTYYSGGGGAVITMTAWCWDWV